jgi:hypothetical protein
MPRAAFSQADERRQEGTRIWSNDAKAQPFENNKSSTLPES